MTTTERDSTKPKRPYPVPEGGDGAELTAICGRAFYLERRGDEVLIWPEDWWEATAPLAVLPGECSHMQAVMFCLGFLRGEEEGEATGKDKGVAVVQAGLRSLLGAASATDLALFARELVGRGEGER